MGIKKCLTTKEFEKVAELLGDSCFRKGSIYYTSKSRYYHIATFICFPQYPAQVISPMLEKYGYNVEFETVEVPTDYTSKEKLLDLIELHNIDKSKITKQTPVCELRVRGYCSGK